MKAKRERKSKFNVREVLNLKESSPKVAKARLLTCRHYLTYPSRKVANMKESPSAPKTSQTLKPSASQASKLLKSSNPAERLDSAASSESYERSDKVFDIEQEVKKENKDIEDSSQSGDIEVVDLSESYEVKSLSEGGCSVSETGSEGTPSEKENINCENNGNDNFMNKSSASESNGVSNGGSNGLGKRARKRKRFADEEVGEGQSAKHQRSLSANSETSKLNVNSNNKLASTGSLVKLEVPKEGSKLQARTPNSPPTARPLTSVQRGWKGSRSPSKTDFKVAKTKKGTKEKAKQEESRRENIEAGTLATPHPQNNNSSRTNSASSGSPIRIFSIAEPAPPNIELSPTSCLHLAALIGSTPIDMEVEQEREPGRKCENKVRHKHLNNCLQDSN